MIDEAAIEREKQRSESEARSIIHDLDKLYTLPEERKTRWVWELLQNAKDVAKPGGVDIKIKLSQDRLIFSHNGQPFTTKHLLAILYKTSTKSLGGEGGTTGKYGTGFVTTHILNKKLTISGIHENDAGSRNFELDINRSFENFEENKILEAVQESLAKTFLEIDNITKSAASEILNNTHSFSYQLTTESYPYAERGIVELEKNIAFTLLINSDTIKKINSVTIEKPESLITYRAIPELTSIEDVSFVSSNSEFGILFYKSDKLTFGLPAKKNSDSFILLPIESQAILFKEFPLIGTEGFNLPALIQHEDFHPTEERDGIRTKKIREDEPDNTADKNRDALKEFVENFIPFAQKIINANVIGCHLLATSGLPEYVERFSNVAWYQDNIQLKLRNFILSQNIVRTYSGHLVKIEDAIFPIYQLQNEADFYSLIATLIPNKVPDESSIQKWIDIINQNAESWPSKITVDEVGLINSIPDNIGSIQNAFDWLKKLYEYLDKNALSHLGEKFPIYLNELNKFCVRDKVRVHPLIDDEYKKVSKGLGRDLDEEFLNRKLGNVPEIQAFNLEEFYGHLNKELISNLNVETATEIQIKAIFHICCLFRSDRAFKREKWFDIIHQLLPHIAVEKKTVSVDYDNYWRSAEAWSVKYVSYLIEKSQKPSVFASIYFQGHVESSFEWLSSFLSFTFDLGDDLKAILFKRKIIPTQSDDFKPYDDFIFAEENPEYFNDAIKDIYKTYTPNKKDPKAFIIDNRISFRGFRLKDVDILTSEIDKIFLDPNIETKVKKGGILNEMFLKLNNWFEQFDSSGKYLRTFYSKRATLYVLALGEGFSKQIMAIQSSGKSIEDIAELAKINLSPQDMKSLESAAAIIGTDKLLAKAQELVKSNEQRVRWKKIGTVAETAFKSVISNIDPLIDVGNPDEGKDFELLLKAKGYSVEIKNVIEGKENVRMSILQGRTAVIEKEHYALCVMTRPNDTDAIDENYFREHSRFVTDIGYKIGDKITRWDEGIRDLIKNEDIKVSLDDKTESVYVNRNIWRDGITFNEFVIELEKYFSLNETHQ